MLIRDPAINALAKPFKPVTGNPLVKMISQKPWNNPSCNGKVPREPHPFGYSEESLRLKIQQAVFNQDHRIGFRGDFQMFLNIDSGFGLECHKTKLAL